MGKPAIEFVHTSFISGRGNLLFPVICFMLFFFACTKKQSNTEIKLQVFYSAVTHDAEKHEDSCKYENPYTEVYAPGKGLLAIDPIDSVTASTILLLDINSDSSVFIFKGKKRCDTLSLHYIREVKSEDHDLIMKAKGIRVTRSTFDSLRTKCKHSANDCNEDIESITVYY